MQPNETKHSRTLDAPGKDTRRDSNPNEEKFQKLLDEAIDDTLCALGEESKKAVYSYFEKKFGSPKADIPARIEDFSQALDALLGVAAPKMEQLILKNLQKKTGHLSSHGLTAVLSSDAFVQLVKDEQQAFVNQPANAKR